MKLYVHTQAFNPFQENTYFVFNDQKDCVIIDPGCYSSEEQTYLKELVEKNDLKILAILNTHAHLDHVFGNAFIKRWLDIPLYLHEKDLPTLAMVSNAVHLYGLPGYDESPLPDFYLEEGQELNFNGITFKVLFTPGHAPGHVVFYNEENNFVINGDVLFQGSYGRTDLPGGDHKVLQKSITEVMFSLPDNTVVYTGHGPATTIGNERTSNPILFG